MTNPQRPLRDGIFDHASSLVECAKASASLGHYGVACALLVLSLEEFIKYQIVLSNSGEEKAFTQQVIDQVFSRHSIKHSLLKRFQQSLSCEAVDVVHQKMLARVLQGNIDTGQDQSEDPFEIIGSFLNIAYGEINLNDDDRLGFIKWLDDADNLKKRGFYVDCVDEKYTFPRAVERSDYDRALKYAVAIQKQTQVIRDLDLSDEEFIEWLNTPL